MAKEGASCALPSATDARALGQHFQTLWGGLDMVAVAAHQCFVIGGQDHWQECVG